MMRLLRLRWLRFWDRWRYRYLLWRKKLRPVQFGSVFVDQIAIGPRLLLEEPVPAHIFDANSFGVSLGGVFVPGDGSVIVSVYVRNHNPFPVRVRVLMLLTCGDGAHWPLPFRETNVLAFGQERVDARPQRSGELIKLLVSLPPLVDDKGREVWVP